jgi:hypothetical protein
MIDRVKLPLEFRRKQTAELIDWKGEPSHSGFQALCEGITTTIGSAPRSHPKPRQGQRVRWTPRWALAAVGTIAVAVGLGVYSVGPWRTTTPMPIAQSDRSETGTPSERKKPLGAVAERPTVVVSLLSANALYREFQNNPVDASAKYVDQAVVLQGRRGEMILLSDGVGAAVHIADGDRPNALILSFPNRKQLKGLDRDATFRFKCTVTKYEFGTVWMQGCSIEAGPGTAASEQIAERPTVVGGLLSANALYRAFESNADDASAKYVGQAMVLEGLRGDVIRMSDGVSAAVHINDRFKSNALILSFPDRTQLAGIEHGTKFRFRCTISKFEYLIVWMENCSIVSR